MERSPRRAWGNTVARHRHEQAWQSVASRVDIRKVRTPDPTNPCRWLARVRCAGHSALLYGFRFQAARGSGSDRLDNRCRGDRPSQRPAGRSTDPPRGRRGLHQRGLPSGRRGPGLFRKAQQSGPARHVRGRGRRTRRDGGHRNHPRPAPPSARVRPTGGPTLSWNTSRSAGAQRMAPPRRGVGLPPCTVPPAPTSARTATTPSVPRPNRTTPSGTGSSSGAGTG